MEKSEKLKENYERAVRDYVIAFQSENKITHIEEEGEEWVFEEDYAISLPDIRLMVDENIPIQKYKDYMDFMVDFGRRVKMEFPEYYESRRHNEYYKGASFCLHAFEKSILYNKIT